jgi:hypothetical protein
MGAQAPEGLLGIHLNFLRQAVGSVIGLPADSEAERAALAALSTFRTSGSGYFMDHATRSQTIGCALLDSPVALSAWMLDHDSSYKISRRPSQLGPRLYPHVIYLSEADKGGHFAAWEEPQLFSEEIRAAFRSLRQMTPHQGSNGPQREGTQIMSTDISATITDATVRPFHAAIAEEAVAALEGELSWSFVACHAAHDLWDDEGWYDLSARYLQLARNVGALAALPLALAQRVGVLLHAGEFGAAASLVEETAVISEATGNDLPLPGERTDADQEIAERGGVLDAVRHDTVRPSSRCWCRRETRAGAAGGK